MRSPEPASAGGMVKTEMKAKTKIISTNFFHIKGPSFRMYLLVFYFIRQRRQRFIQQKSGSGRWGWDEERK
jgi:hypothetical protein